MTGTVNVYQSLGRELLSLWSLAIKIISSLDIYVLTPSLLVVTLMSLCFFIVFLSDVPIKSAFKWVFVPFNLLLFSKVLEKREVSLGE